MRNTNWHQQVQCGGKMNVKKQAWLTFGPGVEVMMTPRLYPLERWRRRQSLLQFWDLKCTESETLVPLNPRRPSSPQNTSLLISWSKHIVSDRDWLEMRFVVVVACAREGLGGHWLWFTTETL